MTCLASLLINILLSGLVCASSRLLLVALMPSLFGIFAYRKDKNPINCIDGDVVAEWIAHGTLNTQVEGSSLSIASCLTM